MIAIIPARGGSKGLPNKNIKLLNGKPLIAYTIEAALTTKYISRVIVTTDCNNIAVIAKEYGAEVPFIRPQSLSGDDSSAIDVYLHTISYLIDNDKINVEKFIVLLPTAPLREYTDITNAIELFEREKATTLISVHEATTPPSWYFKQDVRNRMINAELATNSVMSNRQNNEKYIIPNGAIYILDYKLLKEKRTYYCDNTIAYIMPIEKSVDIDTNFDFMLAEFLISKNENS